MIVFCCWGRKKILNVDEINTMTALAQHKTLHDNVILFLAIEDFADTAVCVYVCACCCLYHMPVTQKVVIALKVSSS